MKIAFAVALGIFAIAVVKLIGGFRLAVRLQCEAAYAPLAYANPKTRVFYYIVLAAAAAGCLALMNNFVAGGAFLGALVVTYKFGAAQMLRRRITDYASFLVRTQKLDEASALEKSKETIEGSLEMDEKMKRLGVD